MELEIKTLLRLLEMIAEERGDAVAENVIMAARQMTDKGAKLIAIAVADGLGVPLD